MSIHRPIAVTTLTLALLIAAGRTHAGAPCCDPINPPDQSADTPDLGFSDSNSDGIDGMACGPIFVSLFGSDMNSGTMDAPMRTIDAAIIAASLMIPVRDVYIAAGHYLESATLQEGVNLYGGYSPVDWSRSGQNTTEICFESAPVRYAGPPTDLTLQLINITALDNTAPGGHSVAVYLNSDSSTLNLEGVVINAGNGGQGPNGTSGAGGNHGSDGSNAIGSNGGSGASASNGPGSNGGPGGDGRMRDSGFSGLAGGNGAPGGQGGNSGMGCNDGDPEPGMNGANGAPGPSGPDGGGGNGFQAVGLPGGNGGSGGGGGGGGAGAGEDCTLLGNCIACGTGRGGGGGGGGAAGGEGSNGGGYGGSSIGIFINDGAVILDSATQIFTLQGGDGGSGGVGGAGGTGGDGGNGGSNADDDDADGGDGGDGGMGGDGGHGGGGSGGWSAGAIFNFSNGAAVVNNGATITPGAAGAGGASLGNVGADGMAIGSQTVGTDLSGLPAVPFPVAAHARGFTEPGVLLELDYAVADPACVAQAVSIVFPPAQGNAQAVGDQLFYTPNAGFNGEITFQFNVIDNQGQCAMGVAHVTVREAGADPCGDVPCTADINGDGAVDTADLGILIGEFGADCQPN